jgi:hypothetical protein
MQVSDNINERRRNLIKFGFFGIGAFVLGKLVNPALPLLEGGMGSKTYTFDNFTVVENGKGLGFYDKSGKEILVLEKDSGIDG